MFRLTNILLLNFAAWFTVTAFGSIKTTQIESIDLTTTLTSTHEWGITVYASVKPVQLISFIALNNPIQLSVYCGDVLLSEPASIFYDDSMIGNVYPLNVTIEKIPWSCKPSTFSFRLNPNGVELDVGSPTFSYSPVDLGETVDSKYNRIKSERPTKLRELIKVTSLLSNSAGSRESLHCLISSYEDDPLASGIVAELKTQYEKLYKSYVKMDIACPVAAQGVLASNVAACKADPLDLSLFCVVYARYVTTKTWYTDSINTLTGLLLQMNSNTESLLEDIKQLQSEMKTDMGNTGSPLVE